MRMGLLKKKKKSISATHRDVSVIKFGKNKKSNVNVIYINVIFQHNTASVSEHACLIFHFCIKTLCMSLITRAWDISLVCVSVRAKTQQRRKCFKLYIPAITDKLREGFVINHKRAALLTKKKCLVGSSLRFRGLLLRSLQPRLNRMLICGTCYFKHISADSARRDLWSCMHVFSHAVLSPQQFF